MLFNSIQFAIFLPIVFILYWSLFSKQVRLRNFFIIAASYLFYGWWDWRFLTLIAFSSGADFILGNALNNTSDRSRRKLLVATSLFLNLGLLGFFKYFNFFIDSFSDLLTVFGLNPNYSTLSIILPVGISFYTFQTLSYTLDIYNKRLEPTKDPLVFFAYVSFFPQLVAGPIERATNLIPQFSSEIRFDPALARDGLKQILWGLVKKVVVADTCAFIVNPIFESYETQPSLHLVVAAVLFAFQIYGDFSGYSDIAIGTGKLLGVRLMTNFKYPYFSRDIGEFWRRWHISLSTWFRDYLYIPLGGSRSSKAATVRNVLIIFIVSGFWHGANWTFIAWGTFHGLLFLPLLLTQRNRSNIGDIDKIGLNARSIRTLISILATFILVCIGWVFFRAESISDAFGILLRMVSFEGQAEPKSFIESLVLILVLVSIEWIRRKDEHPLALQFMSRPVRWSLYVVLCYTVLAYSSTQPSPFVYFQF